MMASAPGATVVYAVGDIHGRADLLSRLLDGIRRDAERRRATRRVIVYLGDYIGRGQQSRQVLELLLSDPLPGFEPVLIKGNQEDVVTRYLGGDLEWGREWYRRGGGYEVLGSYGIRAAPQPKPGLAELDEWRLRLLAVMPSSHLSLLAGLRVYHREGDYLFVHAGVAPAVPLERQSAEYMVWGGIDPARLVKGMSDREIDDHRREFLDWCGDFGAVVVHGHTIVAKPEFRRNRIGIDTGAYRTGVLTAVALEATGQDVIQAKLDSPAPGQTTDVAVLRRCGGRQ